MRKNIFILLGCLAIASAVQAQHAVLVTDAKEIDSEKLAKVKAAFLLNFFKFTTWPESRFDTSTAPFQITILGDDDIGSVLDSTLRGRDWRGHPIQVNRIADSTKINLKATHVIYVAPSSGLSNDDLRTYIEAGILVIGHDINTVKNGAMLGFSIDDGKVSFAFNTATVQQSPLQISSKLLSLGKAVD